MGHPTKDLGEGGGREGRPIRAHAQQRQVTRGQGCFQPTQKGPDVLVGGIMVEDVIENTLVTAIIDRREYTEGTVIEFISSDIPGKIRQGPVQELGVHARLCLFFPPPRPSFESWQRAQRPGGRARGANSRAGRASRLRPRAARRGLSRGGCTDRQGAPEPRGRRESICDTAYSSVAHR